VLALIFFFELCSDASMEADVAKGRRDWAFSERDKVRKTFSMKYSSKKVQNLVGLHNKTFQARHSFRTLVSLRSLPSILWPVLKTYDNRN
jgi:hypothetical protein